MRHLVRPAALVAAYYDTLTPAQQNAAKAVQRALTDAVPALEPSVKWGNLTFSMQGRNAMAIVIHKAHLNLQVFNGAALEQQFPELEGAGRGMRHLKLRYGHPLDAQRLGALAQASVGFDGGSVASGDE